MVALASRILVAYRYDTLCHSPQRRDEIPNLMRATPIRYHTAPGTMFRLNHTAAWSHFAATVLVRWCNPFSPAHTPLPHAVAKGGSCHGCAQDCVWCVVDFLPVMGHLGIDQRRDGTIPHYRVVWLFQPRSTHLAVPALTPKLVL